MVAIAHVRQASWCLTITINLESGAVITFWQRQDACAWAIAALELPSTITKARSMPCNSEARKPQRLRFLCLCVTTSLPSPTCHKRSLSDACTLREQTAHVCCRAEQLRQVSGQAEPIIHQRDVRPRTAGPTAALSRAGGAGMACSGSLTWNGRMGLSPQDRRRDGAVKMRSFSHFESQSPCIA